MDNSCCEGNVYGNVIMYFIIGNVEKAQWEQLDKLSVTISYEK